MKHLRVTLLAVVLLITATNIFAQQTAESFQTFWESYTTDSTFQEGRTLFPLPFSYWDFSDFEIEDTPRLTDSISAKDCSYQDFSDTPDYQVKIQQKYVTYVVVFLGEENGICVEYVFGQYDGKWYLTKIDDYSN